MRYEISKCCLTASEVDICTEPYKKINFIEIL